MANKERAIFTLDENVDDLNDLSDQMENLAKIPPQPAPTKEQMKKMRQVSEELGFPSRNPQSDEQIEKTRHQNNNNLLANEQNKVESQKMTLVIPASLHRDFKSKAASNGEKMTEILIRYMQQYIKL